jgi:transcription elongation factor Elf1
MLIVFYLSNVIRKEKQASHQNVAKSQLKLNEAAQSILCAICMQSFMCTANEAMLR